MRLAASVGSSDQRGDAIVRQLQRRAGIDRLMSSGGPQRKAPGRLGAIPGTLGPVRTCEGSKEAHRSGGQESAGEAGEALHQSGQLVSGDLGRLIFHIVTASVTALTQISASMVVPSSRTTQSLMSRPSREKKASALNKPVSPSPENIRGVTGSKATVARLRAVVRSLN